MNYLNNFNPNLIKRRGTPQLGGHTSLLNRNQSGGPIKIKNNKNYNNYISNNNSGINNNHYNNHANRKKPTTPDLNLNHRQKHDFLDINSNNENNNSNNNINHNKYNKYNNMNLNNNNNYNINNRANNTMPNGFGLTGGPNNYKKNTSNNSPAMTRPSTAPHKDKDKMNMKNNKNNYQNNNYGRIPFKHNQRPSSAGGKNKNMYNNYNNNRIGIGLGKNMSNSNMNTKNRKKKLINEINKRLSTPQINSSSNSNMMGFNNNINVNYGNNDNLRPKLNHAKNRMPSPMIKSSNNYKRPPLPNKNRNKIRTNKSDKFN